MRTFLAGVGLWILTTLAPAVASTFPDPTFTTLVLNAPYTEVFLTAGQPVGFQFTLAVPEATVAISPDPDSTSFTTQLTAFDPTTSAVLHDVGLLNWTTSVGIGLDEEALWNLTILSSVTTDFRVAFFDVTPTPLPSSLMLFIGGLAALAVFGWRKKRKLIAA